MQPSQILFVVCSCVLFLTSFRQSHAFGINRADVADPDLTIAILDELAEALREKNPSASDNLVKRRYDGYRNRFGTASLGSKLMALKTAADWNNPGRKKRDTQMH